MGVVIVVVVVGGGGWGFWTYTSILCSAPDKRQHDQTFVPALVPVHSIDLHTRKCRGQQHGGDAFQLLPVGCDDAYVAGLTPCLEKKKRKQDAHPQ